VSKSASVDDASRAGGEAVSPEVAALLGHLAEVGFDGSPRVLGVGGDNRRTRGAGTRSEDDDEDGRQRVEAVPGRRAGAATSLGCADLVRVGLVVRRLHDAAATFVPPPGARWRVGVRPDAEDLVCHHDLVPANLVLGDRWVFVGWDGAGPGSRLWDLAWAAAAFVPFAAVGDRSVDAPRLRALADGYGLDGEQRRRLPALIGARLHAAAEGRRRQPVTTNGPVERAELVSRAELADRWDAAADRVAASHDTWVVTLLA